MPLLESLLKNTEGIFFYIPDNIEILQQSDNELIFREAEKPVLWVIYKSMFDLDLTAEHQPMLLKDLATFARNEFEFKFYQKNVDPTPSPFNHHKPRTDDPNWSPIISAEIVNFGKTPALHVLRRLSYQPGSESIWSHLMIPTAQATYEINMCCAATTTGHRESALYMLLMKKNEGVDPSTLMKSVTQSYYDDPANDEMFPQHPLSELRRTYHWLLSDQGGDLKITSPAPKYPNLKARLEDIGCAVTIPPGYIYSKPISGAMGKVSAIFVRVILSLGSIGDGKMMLSFWRPINRKIDVNNSRAELKQFAIKSTQDWQNVGVKDIDIETTDLPDFNGHPQLSCLVNFKIQNVPSRALARWFTDNDGNIFRVEISGPPFLDTDDLNRELETILKSWRPVTTGDQPASSDPKWNLWN